MNGISTHILDLSRGCPAVAVVVTLLRRQDDSWHEISINRTDQDGRIKAALPAGETLHAGVYLLHFDSGAYFRSLGIESFHPFVEITFQIHNAAEHYHVPLLLTPYSYSTYRGS
jgi:5-hydroxyisourate hydrolase